MSSVIAYFGACWRVDENIQRLKLGGLNFRDVNNDVTIEELNLKMERLLTGLMCSFFKMNTKYHEESGKYLCGKKEKALETAKEIYYALADVI